KSRRETEKTLLSLSPRSVPKETVRAVSPTETEIKIVVDDILMAKVKKVKSLLSHKNRNPKYAELLNELLEVALDKLDLERKAERVAARKTTQSTLQASATKATPVAFTPPTKKQHNACDSRQVCTHTSNE